MARVTKERAVEALHHLREGGPAWATAAGRNAEARDLVQCFGLNAAYAKALVDVLAYAEEQLTKESK